MCAILTELIPFPIGYLLQHQEVTAASRVGWPGTSDVLRNGSQCCRGEKLVLAVWEVELHEGTHRLDVTDISVLTALLHS